MCLTIKIYGWGNSHTGLFVCLFVLFLGVFVFFLNREATRLKWFFNITSYVLKGSYVFVNASVCVCLRFLSSGIKCTDKNNLRDEGSLWLSVHGNMNIYVFIYRHPLSLRISSVDRASLCTDSITGPVPYSPSTSGLVITAHLSSYEPISSGTHVLTKMKDGQST